MGQRVYLLCLEHKFNIVGIYSNIRQVRKNIQLLNDAKNILLFEIRMNEPPTTDGGKNVTFMLQQEDSCMIDNIIPIQQSK